MVILYQSFNNMLKLVKNDFIVVLNFFLNFIHVFIDNILKKVRYYKINLI